MSVVWFKCPWDNQYIDVGIDEENLITGENPTYFGKKCLTLEEYNNLKFNQNGEDANLDGGKSGGGLFGWLDHGLPTPFDGVGQWLTDLLGEDFLSKIGKSLILLVLAAVVLLFLTKRK